MYNNKTKLYEGFIYIITNNINKKKYIGQTTISITERWKQHCNAIIRKGATLLDKKIKQYGKESFSIVELNKYTSETLADLKNKLDIEEQKYIRRYNTMTVDQGGYGYNVDSGGQSNNVFGISIDLYDIEGNFITTYSSKSEASRITGVNARQIYDICHGISGNYRCLCVFRLHGDPFDKYDIKSKGYIEIYQFDLSGNLVNKYYSYSQVYKATGISFVGDIIDNPNRIASGYWWSTNNIFNYLGEKKKEIKKIIQYDLWGNIINEYPSISKCYQSTGFNRKAITNNCNGITPTLKQYIFRYEGDCFTKFMDIFREDILLQILIYHYPILKYSKDWDLISKYDSIDAYDKLIGANKKKRDIVECCLSKRESALGYHWSFCFD